MSFQESNNIIIPKDTWTKVSDVDTIFQIKGSWTIPIYYIETTEDLSDELNPTLIRIKNPDPKTQEIAYIQSGTKANDRDFENFTFKALQGSLWVYAKDTDITILKDIILS